MRKLIIILFAIFICQAITAQAVSLEIKDIPNRYFGLIGAAFIMIPGEGGIESPRLIKEIDTNTFSGAILNDDGTEFKISDARFGAGYIVILIFIRGEKAELTMYSKQFVITNDTVKLNFRGDFSPDPRRALSR